MYDLLAEYEKYKQTLRKDIDEVLSTHVAEDAKNVILQHVENDVYSAYTPIMYNRRGEYGGLADLENLESTVVNGTLTISNKTPFSDSDDAARAAGMGMTLVDVIESGSSAFGMPDGVERKFWTNADNELSDITDNSTKSAEYSLAFWLAYKKGYNIDLVSLAGGGDLF